MKTFIEQLEEASTTFDGQLQNEIYLQLYREDLLRDHARPGHEIVQAAVLKTSDKPKTWDARFSEHEHRDDYNTWDLTWRILLEYDDGAIKSVQGPGFQYSFADALRLLPPKIEWTMGYDQQDEKRPFWVTINLEQPVRHTQPHLAVALAAVIYRTKELDHAKRPEPAAV